MRIFESRRKNAMIAALFCGVSALLAANLLGLHQTFPVVHADPPATIKYTGAGSCSASQCHGAPTAKPGYAGDCQHNENTTWQAEDLHFRAFSGEGGKRGLANPQSKEIAKKLNIPSADKSERCLSCHALSGTALMPKVHRISLKTTDIRADDVTKKKYMVENGVSCDACHGPAEKYLEPHVAKLWTQNKRKELGSQKLYDEWGLLDTKNLKFRANTCMSCHLKIEHDLIEAGHPELPFELDGFSQGAWVHWRDKGAWFSTKAWAMGQMVALREAAQQLADRVKGKASEGLQVDSYKQMTAHMLMGRHVARVLDEPSLMALTTSLKSVNDNWSDPAKVEASLREIAKTADALADKLEPMQLEKEINRAAAEKLVLGVAAEGEVAGSRGYRSAEQYTLSMKSLWGTMVRDAKPGDGEAKMAVVDDLYTPLGDAVTYDASKFVPAAKKVISTFIGGASLPLPPGGPGSQNRPPDKAPPVVVQEKPPEKTPTPPPQPAPPVVTQTPPPVTPPQPQPAPPVQPPVAQPAPPPVVATPPAPEPAVRPGPAGKVIFCPECGNKWPAEFKYCPRDGHSLPRLE